MKPQHGVLSVLTTTTHIVFLNFCHLLRLSALTCLLLYFFKALAFPAAPSSITSSTLKSISLLGNVFIVLHVSLEILVLWSNRTLNPNPNPYFDFKSCLCFVFFSVALANQLNAVYTSAGTISVCRNFAISAMLGVIAGALYTVLTMCRLDKCYPIVEEIRTWVDCLIMWCKDVVQTSKWVAAVAFGIAFGLGPSFDSFLPAWIQANADVLSVIWRWVAAGMSVSLLPLLFLCVMSTHVTLYLSCRTHHKNSSADSFIAYRSDSSAPSVDEVLIS